MGTRFISEAIARCRNRIYPREDFYFLPLGGGGGGGGGNNFNGTRLVVLRGGGIA